ncbi:MAG TPA: MetS family NSS transporter small subunit [bacterium]|jgi:hypothetical protein
MSGESIAMLIIGSVILYGGLAYCLMIASWSKNADSEDDE